jgi:FdhD protein
MTAQTLTADDEPTEIPSAIQRRTSVAYKSGEAVSSTRAVPEETAIALTYDGATQAVMMATPQDLEDFAVGFSLTERIVASKEDIQSLDVVPLSEGVELRMWLAKPIGDALSARRRHLAGPTGCGLCGIDSLSEAVRAPPKVGDKLRIGAGDIATALDTLPAGQSLNRETRAVHAAGFWRRAGGLVAVREDVGRHNALDKLVGAMARSGESGADGLLLLTSRVSIEMVQKAAALGAEILVAVSAPTALAIRTAEAAGITLIAIARADGFEVFTHPHRIRS